MPPDTDIEIAAELAGTGAPPWLGLLIREIRALRGDFAELAREVRGGGAAPGHSEQLRTLDARVSLLERITKWGAGIGTTIALTAALAWARFVTEFRPPAGHP